jgi:hypothetical protein
MHAVPEHPYAHVVHHASSALDWHSWLAVQTETVCQVSHTRFPVPHVALVPVQFWYWYRIRAVAPQDVLEQP